MKICAAFGNQHALQFLPLKIREHDAFICYIANQSEVYDLSGFFLFFVATAINASGKVVQCYLYTGLRNQTIWQSTRFWNAAIFLALQLDRSTRPTKIPV